MRFIQHANLASTLLIFLGTVPAFAATYYVAPTGSDSGDGSQTTPFATLTKANSAAAAGDTIYVRGGTYYITSQLVLSKSGTSDSNRTNIWAYPGETPVLDASRYVTSNTAADVPVVLVTGNWMHLKGLEIGNAKVGASGDHSYSLLRTKSASNNTFELLNLHHGFGPGLFIDTGSGGNLILNCDSHDNYDVNGSQGDGQNGDGFGVHYQTTGPSTLIRGCRAWMDSDDGYDFIYQEVPVTIENSYAFNNGYGSSGNGNGFKMGSSGTGIRHIVQNNVAWGNKASGFYANHSSGGNTWYNNTSYNNGTQYNMLAATFESDGRTIATDGITLTGSKVHIMRNNIGFPNKNANMNGVDSAYNTWDLNITQAANDFISTSETGCTGPREADGSVPAACTNLHLQAGSPLIDEGTDVGLPYNGKAPDLGCFEYGGAGTGGSPSMGGAPATGGSKATGGAAATGGTAASTSSSKATGGLTSAGGTAASTGGSKATGGLSNVGGNAMGGVAATGGLTNAGGYAPTTGGSKATGGLANVGGNATGGVAATGGLANAAGTANVGGGVPTGGAANIGGSALLAGGAAIAGGLGNIVGGGSSADTSTNASVGGGETSSDAGSCGCRIPSGGNSSTGLAGRAALIALAFTGLLRRRR